MNRPRIALFSSGLMGAPLTERLLPLLGRRVPVPLLERVR
ncbi:hypothetical protein MNBD_GAMMA20-1509 [hydrothermal vent metagenome]|uniref:Uncharacterized protein n=1 Tax=hydrothermal vent metagenome TaxID=652676 RepID=A0A3B1AGX3_9ZZZZ